MAAPRRRWLLRALGALVALYVVLSLASYASWARTSTNFALVRERWRKARAAAATWAASELGGARGASGGAGEGSLRGWLDVLGGGDDELLAAHVPRERHGARSSADAELGIPTAVARADAAAAAAANTADAGSDVEGEGDFIDEEGGGGAERGSGRGTTAGSTPSAAGTADDDDDAADGDGGDDGDTADNAREADGGGKDGGKDESLDWLAEPEGHWIEQRTADALALDLRRRTRWCVHEACEPAKQSPVPPAGLGLEAAMLNDTRVCPSARAGAALSAWLSGAAPPPSWWRVTCATLPKLQIAREIGYGACKRLSVALVPRGFFGAADGPGGRRVWRDPVLALVKRSGAEGGGGPGASEAERAACMRAHEQEVLLGACLEHVRQLPTLLGACVAEDSVVSAHFLVSDGFDLGPALLAATTDETEVSAAEAAEPGSAVRASRMAAVSERALPRTRARTLARPLPTMLRRERLENRRLLGWALAKQLVALFAELAGARAQLGALSGSSFVLSKFRAGDSHGSTHKVPRLWLVDASGLRLPELGAAAGAEAARAPGGGGAPCARDAECAPTSWLHCCCGVHAHRHRFACHGAPEAAGVCNMVDRKCMAPEPEAALVHAAGSMSFLLPDIAAAALPKLETLLEAMRLPAARDRPSLAQADSWLDRNAQVLLSGMGKVDSRNLSAAERGAGPGSARRHGARAPAAEAAGAASAVPASLSLALARAGGRIEGAPILLRAHQQQPPSGGGAGGRARRSAGGGGGGDDGSGSALGEGEDEDGLDGIGGASDARAADAVRAVLGDRSAASEMLAEQHAGNALRG